MNCGSQVVVREGLKRQIPEQGLEWKKVGTVYQKVVQWEWNWRHQK